MKKVLLVILILLINCLFAWFYNLPEDIGLDVPEGKLNGLSFAPFHEGQSPLTQIFPTAEQIGADLHLLSSKTHSIRTYATRANSATPLLARQEGLNILQGAWLGFIPEDNILEVIRLIQMANAYPDVIKRVIVGNEVLLRNELEVDELIHFIRLVKQAVKQPVSYADVWSMYMKYPQIMQEIDFLTIHILPYWEDAPISIDEAPAHTERVYKRIQAEAASLGIHKPILIGESGWPSAGRQRGAAVPSVVNEAKFIRSLIKIAKDNGFDVNIVEAINQSWKSELEGVVGANWGLLSVNREQVFPLTGPVYENPDWYQEHIAAVVLFLLIAMATWKYLANLSSLQAGFFLFLLHVFTLLWISQIEQLWYVSYTDWQRAQTILLVGLNAVAGGLISQRCYVSLTAQTASPKLGYHLLLILSIFIGYAFYKTFTLANNGRYISFPTPATYLPVIGLSALMLVRCICERSWRLESIQFHKLIGYLNPQPAQYKLIGYALLTIGGYMLIGETMDFMRGGDMVSAYPDFITRLGWSLTFTFGNLQLLTWLACLAVFAVPLLLEQNYKREF